VVNPFGCPELHKAKRILSKWVHSRCVKKFEHTDPTVRVDVRLTYRENDGSPRRVRVSQNCQIPNPIVAKARQMGVLSYSDVGYSALSIPSPWSFGIVCYCAGRLAFAATAWPAENF
jgi:hypothetical protein